MTETAIKNLQKKNLIPQDGVKTNILQQEQLPTLESPSRIISSKDFMNGFKEEVWRIKGFMPSGELGEIFGASASRKTFLALDIATCVHNGIEWHGMEVTKCNVLYVCGEGKNGVRKRISAFSNHYNVEEAMHILPTTIDMKMEDSMQLLAKDIKDIKGNYGLVIIDTLNANTSGAEDSADDFASMKRNLEKYLVKDGRMVAWVHHTGNVEGTRSRGTSARYAGVDWSVQVKKDEKFSSITCRKMKEAEDFDPLTFSFDSVATNMCEEDGSVLFSIVPKIEKGAVIKKAVAHAKYNDEICKGIRLALKEGKGVLPTEDFEKMFDLRSGGSRVLHIDTAREYAYKMYEDERKSQAFNRWLKSAQKSAHAFFYDAHILLSNDAKLHKVKK